MRKLTLILLTILTFQLQACGQQEATTTDGKKVLLYDNSTRINADSIPLNKIKITPILKLELPKTNSKDIVISHTGYSLLYNETHEQASWVAYELTKEETKKIAERNDKFISDPEVKTETANDKDYAGSGYDKGHLAPAADMGWSFTTMAESFYYSNMSPQDPGFNRGVWKRLEELARTWAIENNSVYIVTGPVLTAGLSTIGANKVSIPKYFYKVIFDYSEPGIKGIGFIIPNTGSKAPLLNFAVTIDSIEKFTGIDFFPLLPDSQENLIEATLGSTCWTWKSVKIENPEEEVKYSGQCKGITKAGNRCKKQTVNVSGYCYLHESQKEGSTNSPAKAKKRATSVQCAGITKAGNRCKHMTYSPNGKCFQHGGD